MRRRPTFALLGPLEARLDGDPVALGGVKQRSVLALLLLRPNEVVSTARLIDELWGGTPPETATTALHGYVSQLRKALEPERRTGEESAVLVTRAPGYVLRVEPGDIDLERFDALVATARAATAAGDPAEASTALAAALALCRGAPLADLADEPFARDAVAPLEERRVAALEDRIDADLALGRHAALVPELEAAVRAEPLRERLRGQLVLALYRSGRQGDALQAYAEARRTLVEQLGLEPGPALRGLERQILAQDPALDAPGPAEAPARDAAPAGAPRHPSGGGVRSLRSPSPGVVVVAIVAGLLWAGSDDEEGGAAGAPPATSAAVPTSPPRRSRPPRWCRRRPLPTPSPASIPRPATSRRCSRSERGRRRSRRGRGPCGR